MTKTISATLLTAFLAAGFSTSPAAEAKLDPKAREVVESAEKYVQSLKSYSAKVTAVIVKGEEKKTITVDYAFAQPNKFRWVVSMDGEEASGTISDGEKLYNYSPPAKSYMIEDAPLTMAELASADQLPHLTIISFLLLPDAFEAITGSDESATLGEKKMIDGKEFNVVVESNGDSKRELVFSTGANPLPTRVTISAKVGDSVADTTFADVKVNETLPASLFSFTAKSDWKKIDPQNPEDLRAAADKMLLGKTAPDFTLKSPDGTPFTLSSEKGKNIVLLDLWASWCGPCRRSLPHLQDLVEKYRGKDVRFFAVNQMETSEQATGYMKENNLEKIPLLLDVDGVLVNPYGSESIPRMAIIGKDGTVQFLQSGYGESTPAKLAAALDKLLAGEKLVKDPVPAAASN
ncbi:hypothetical protein BH09SUM1_BH09SUM1_26940 [soil metagenome]